MTFVHFWSSMFSWLSYTLTSEGLLNHRYFKVQRQISCYSVSSYFFYICSLNDLGLETFSLSTLFTRIFIPTSFLLVCILHLHYFHERFLQLTDLQAVVAKEESTIYRWDNLCFSFFPNQNENSSLHGVWNLFKYLYIFLNYCPRSLRSARPSKTEDCTQYSATN